MVGDLTMLQSTLVYMEIAACVSVPQMCVPHVVRMVFSALDTKAVSAQLVTFKRSGNTCFLSSGGQEILTSRLCQQIAGSVLLILESSLLLLSTSICLQFCVGPCLFILEPHGQDKGKPVTAGCCTARRPSP